MNVLRGQFVQSLLGYLGICLSFLIFGRLSGQEGLRVSDSFIEDIFEIQVPGVEGAYNASMVEWENGYLMAFRYDTFKIPVFYYIDDFYQHIGIIQLDENFEAKDPWYPCIGNRTYDPRLLKIHDKIYLIFASPQASETNSCRSSHLNLCHIDYLKDRVEITNLVELSVPFQQTFEKNWILFNYKNKIHVSYTINPHVVMKPSLENGTCEVLANTNRQLHWPYGLIRGGTPAQLLDGQFLGFFHSSVYMPHLRAYTYYIGAYTFLDKPPFNLTRISRQPFSHSDFYSSTKNDLTTSDVLFPGSFIVKNDKIYLCYGENDSCIKMMVIDKEALYDSLVEIKN